MASYSNAEAGLPQPDYEIGFSNKQIRNRFVQKVYAILSMQFLLTFGVCSLCMFVQSIKDYLGHNQWPLYTAMGVYLVVGLTIICCKQLQRTVPWNYILLITLTIAMSIMLGVVCAFTNIEAVLIAAGITFVTTLAVSLFSCWTKFDFTRLIWIACMCGFVIMMAGIVLIFYSSKRAQVLYAAGGTLLCMLYLAIDTQLIMGGRRYEISEEDYIFAALTLYLDIVQLFLFILRLVKN